MRGLWFEEYERLLNKREHGEPDFDEIKDPVVERLANYADTLKDRAKEDRA